MFEINVLLGSYLVQGDIVVYYTTSRYFIDVGGHCTSHVWHFGKHLLQFDVL